MITSLLLAEGLAQLGCGIGAGIAVIGAGIGIVQVLVLVRLVVAPLMLLPASQRLLVRSSPR